MNELSCGALEVFVFTSQILSLEPLVVMARVGTLDFSVDKKSRVCEIEGTYPQFFNRKIKGF